ncbi:MAG: TonB-dependent receptor [Chitinophagaceae bacterium]
MRPFLLFLSLLFLSFSLQAQHRISGMVSDTKGKPVAAANVYLDNTLDGSTTDSTGKFSFETSEKGAQTLIASGVGYENGGQPVTVDKDLTGLVLKIRASPKSLDGVTVTAGAYEAGNDKNKSVLTTLDIITTAGAQADVVRAIQTLPGTQQQGTETGLFVRGGDASEAEIIVDGLVSQDAFFSGAPGVATRSRFSAFQVKGVSFSSGGYSARYGQALSSVLELNTLDFPDKSTVNLGLNMAGIYASGSKLWKNSAADATFSYTNLAPFYGLASSNVNYYKVPQGGSGSARYAWKPNPKGMVKVMVSATHFASGVTVPQPDSPGTNFNYGIVNTNIYSSITYNQSWKKWNLYTAAAYTDNKDDITAGSAPITEHDNRAQGRVELKRYLAAKLNITIGGELQHFSYKKKVDVLDSSYNLDFTETATAGFAELNWSPQRWIAIRPGIRAEHSDLLHQNTLMPRIAIALRAGTYGLVSLSGGTFYQLPDVAYLQYGYRPNMQEAIHYIASYQWIKDDRTLRLEGYYKDYKDLVREPGVAYDPNAYRTYYGQPDNSGYGYAQGLELFWRDKKSVKNLDYWISYSYIDTRRLYKNYQAEVQPDFIANNNASIIAKYYIPNWTTQINVTYGFATGRPYYNPNNSQFLADKTPDYHNLSFTINYLTNVKKWFTVVYAGIDNVTNRKNVFGYRYNVNGDVRYPQYPALFRTYFVGANFSLTEFNKDEL